MLLAKLSLWLDEILDLIGVSHYELAPLLAYVALNPGGVPLGYFTQAATVHWLGCSSFSGRLPSAIFAIASAVGLFRLGLRLKLRWPLLAVLIFCIMPLNLRYALEARPYSQALALTVWATVVFFEIIEKPRAGRALIYSLLITAGLYTQPYTLFVPCAHVFWLCGCKMQQRRRVLLLVLSAIALAGLSFLPWYLYASRIWHSAIGARHYSIGAGAVLLIVREMTGAGYIGIAVTLYLVWLGLTKKLSSFSARYFWALYITVPVLLAVLGDIYFGYFLAIRQMIFVLPPLALLATAGLEEIFNNRKHFAIASCTLLIVLLAGDVGFFARPRENWRTAALTLSRLAQSGTCLLFVPADSASIYSFFDSGLPRRSCQGDLSKLAHVAVAFSPYAATAELNSTQSELRRNGLTNTGEFNPQGPQVYVYTRSKQE